MRTRVVKHGVGASGHGVTGWGQALIARARICVVRRSMVHGGLVDGCGAGVCGGRFICLPVFQPAPQATQGDGVTGRKGFGIHPAGVHSIRPHLLQRGRRQDGRVHTA